MVNDPKPNLDKGGAARCAAIEGYDLHPYFLAIANGLGPLVFQRTISVTVEVGVLREMIEGVGGTVEAPGDIMPAIVGCPTIRAAGVRLGRAGLGLGGREHQLTRYLPRVPAAIYSIVITLAGDAPPCLARRCIGPIRP